MTCVVALTDGQRIVVGADSAGSSFEGTGEIHTIAIPKIFRVNGYLLGFSGSWFVGQVVRHHVGWREPADEAADLQSFLLTQILPEINRALAQAGYDKTIHGTWQVLVARAGQIFMLSSRLELLRTTTPYVAIGSGRFVAYGAFHAWMQREGLGLEETVERVLEAVCQFVPGVREPFVIESI